jgi:general secretion pathway protein F
MTAFSYKATDAYGKILKGTLEAADEREVVAKLQAMNCIPIRIERGSGMGGKFSFSGTFHVPNPFKRITQRDVLFFTQDLHALLEAGLAMDKALSILIDVSENDKFKEVVAGILKSIEGGSSLSEALTNYPKVFSTLYINMTRAGETGGVLPAVLDRLSLFLEISQDLRDYVVSAMVYPLFLVFVGGVSIIIMLTFVIPKFSVIFADMGQAMPLSTKILLGLSNGLRNYWWLIAGFIAAAAVLIQRYIKTPAGRMKADRIKISSPVIGKLVRSIEVARFSRTLGTLIKSGVPILMALQLVREIVTNQIIAGSLQIVYDRVKEGDSLSSPLIHEGIFPPLAVQMISVGEETGKLDQMLLRVAENYEKTVRNMIKRFVNLLEPVMILTMGLMVGFIVISMLLAVFSMNDIPF